MGMDPLTLGLIGAGASGLYGAVSQNKTNKANLNAATARQNKIDSYAMPYLQQGQNPFAQMLIRSVGGTQGFNSGQDGFMQFLNRGGAQFDNSEQFKALNVLDQRGIGEQVAQLHGSAGSLGQRFGTAMNRNEGNLRRDALQNIGARNAGIASSSFESGAQRGLQAQGLLAQILGQAGGLQQGQQNSNVNILSLLAGQGVPQQQPNALPGAAGDISQLLMFLPFLRGLGGGGQRPPVSGTPNNAGPYFVPGAPTY